MVRITLKQLGKRFNSFCDMVSDLYVRKRMHIGVVDIQGVKFFSIAQLSF